MLSSDKYFFFCSLLITVISVFPNDVCVSYTILVNFIAVTKHFMLHHQANND